MDQNSQNADPQKYCDNDQNQYKFNNAIKLNDVFIEKQNDVQQTEINLGQQVKINIIKVDTLLGINSQKECQVQQNSKMQQQQSSNQTERQQKDQIEQLGNLNNHSLEQSTAVNTLRSSQNVYIQNYDTAGICEQNFCYCFTHTVDIITLLLAFLVGRTAHRQIFVWRIILSIIFDIGLPVLILCYFDSLKWYFIFGQMCICFVLLFSSLLAISQETPRLAKFSLAINLPFVSLFKIIIRCSNNLFCREDQVNTASYLSHRPIISLYMAHIAKSAILSSTLICYITVLSLTINKIETFQSSKLALYIAMITFYSLDLLRNAYQAIVAENNHRLKANAYKDISYKRSFSNELAQDVSIQNYDNQSKYKQDINQLLETQNIKQQKKIIDENAKTNKISSLYVNNNQNLNNFLTQANNFQAQNIEKQKNTLGDLKKAKKCNYRGLVGIKISESNNDVVFYDKNKDKPEDQMLQSLEMNERDLNQQKQGCLNSIEQQQKEEQIKNQMNELLKFTLNDNKFQQQNESIEHVHIDNNKENQNQVLDLENALRNKSFSSINQKMENQNIIKSKSCFSKTLDLNNNPCQQQLKIITEPDQQNCQHQNNLIKLNKLNSAQSKSIDFL